MFNVTLSNVPIVNLRTEFREFYEKAHSQGFLSEADGIARPLQTRYFTWLATPHAGATMMMSRSISGVESYIGYAVKRAAAARGRLTDRVEVARRNPFVLGGGAADSCFNRLPALVATEIAMQNAQPTLWLATRAFYKEVRNPVFHGRELRDLSDDAFAALYDHLANIYDWIDSWFDPDDLLRGGKQAFAGKRPEAAT